ncbi:hypothetical protein [Inhella crocodyli]|uniref:Toxin-antitoxin system YwqK family antitoxin n=1 Tax=Inhella crocodyli TaxID=2499851 RepID=A0A3S2U9W0_9BURK|nr:hypothetical protein [Inhella crocodyli]RVT82444.1 hypothetical protein EOD73_17070 [Inhella crocodyli]
MFAKVYRLIFGYAGALTSVLLLQIPIYSANAQTKGAAWPNGLFEYEVNDSGKPSGNYNEWDRNGRFKISATFKDGTLNGPLKVINLENSFVTLEGELSAGKKVGRWIHRDLPAMGGRVIIQEFTDDGRPTGEWQLQNKSGGVSTQKLTDGTGSIEMWDKGRLLARYEFKDGLLDGEQLQLIDRPQNLAVASNYKKGKLNGAREYFVIKSAAGGVFTLHLFDAAQRTQPIVREQWLDGRRHGTWEVWIPGAGSRNRPAQSAIYENNKLVSVSAPTGYASESTERPMAYPSTRIPFETFVPSDDAEGYSVALIWFHRYEIATPGGEYRRIAIPDHSLYPDFLDLKESLVKPFRQAAPNLTTRSVDFGAYAKSSLIDIDKFHPLNPVSRELVPSYGSAWWIERATISNGQRTGISVSETLLSGRDEPKAAVQFTVNYKSGLMDGPLSFIDTREGEEGYGNAKNGVLHGPFTVRSIDLSQSGPKTSATRATIRYHNGELHGTSHKMRTSWDSRDSRTSVDTTEIAFNKGELVRYEVARSEKINGKEGQPRIRESQHFQALDLYSSPQHFYVYSYDLNRAENRLTHNEYVETLSFEKILKRDHLKQYDGPILGAAASSTAPPVLPGSPSFDAPAAYTGVKRTTVASGSERDILYITSLSNKRMMAVIRYRGAPEHPWQTIKVAVEAFQTKTFYEHATTLKQPEIKVDNLVFN